MFGGILTLYIAVALRNPSLQIVSFAALLLAGRLISYAWIAFFRLEIGPETLTYRCLLGGRTTVRWTDVSAARDIFIKSSNPRLGRAHSIEIRTKIGVEPSRLMVNPKVFPLDAVRDLRHSLENVWTSPKETFVQLVR
jgi:hypothetical protein